MQIVSTSESPKLVQCKAFSVLLLMGNKFRKVMYLPFCEAKLFEGKQRDIFHEAWQVKCYEKYQLIKNQNAIMHNYDAYIEGLIE